MCAFKCTYIACQKSLFNSEATALACSWQPLATKSKQPAFFHTLAGACESVKHLPCTARVRPAASGAPNNHVKVHCNSTQMSK
jgi:hypothetical protein